VNITAPEAVSVTAPVPVKATALEPVGVTVTAVPDEGVILYPLSVPVKTPLTGAVPAT